ncbi:MAG: PDZ domain-containing protein [candidate division WOR-3 bacterium]|nr:MAG: PDZ domain-containing protein [candidate division WOR-3 bacterium]
MFKSRYLIICVLALSLFAQAFGADVSTYVHQLVQESDAARLAALEKNVLEMGPSAEELVDALKNAPLSPASGTGIVRRKNLCIDGIERPYYLYIPTQYDHQTMTPLLVYLHGGVSREELASDVEEFIEELPFTELAEQRGYILLVPLGQYGATWWDSVGIANVLQQIRNTKQEFNIDDDRVYMTGFSDGGSGSFLFAMCCPSYFAGFLPLNGHPGVGSEVGEIQTYFVNLYNRPVYVINTTDDRLYPAAEIFSMMELGHQAQANVMYRIYAGIEHSFDYADEEMPLMHTFMMTHPRSLPASIQWETAYPDAGCDWLAVNEIQEQEEPAGWHEDHNMELTDDRVMFGFYPDYTYEGDGALVDRIAGDSTLCGLIGVQAGDVITALDGSTIKDLDELNGYKQGKQCGDSITLTIKRGDEELTLRGAFPGPFTYSLFTRGKPSAQIRGYYSGNTFSFETSRVASFTVYIHPDMVRLDQPVTVRVNGKTVYNELVEASPVYVLENYLKHRDRARLFVNKLPIICSE